MFPSRLPDRYSTAIFQAIRFFLSLCCGIFVVFSAGAGESQTVSGHVPAAVARSQSTGRVPADSELHLAIGLPLRNRAGLTNLLQRLYDPASPDFHHFLSAEQFAEQFGPTREDYQALTDYVQAGGLKVAGTHSNRALLDVSGSVSNIETLLHLKLHFYPHPTESRDFFAPDTDPKIDAAVPVLHISGLDNYLRPRPMSLKRESAANLPTPALGSAPGGAYMGNDFRAAYVPGTTLTGAGQTVGLLEFDGYFQSDVAAYRNVAGLPVIPLKNVLLDGFNGVPGGNNVEVALDIDMASSMAPGLSGIIVYEGETTDDILNRMATDNLAKQLSASWLYPIDPVSEQIFQQFGAQGQSFFNASGDYDAYVGSIDTPADDPNITIVGGTTLSTSGPGGSWVSETVWNWDNGTGSGGGVSSTYAIPTWQRGISMVANNGSTNMRNLPDVALTADNIWLAFNDGATGIFGGTSCATPLWAALTALINQQALANGKTTQGFLNPAVYALCTGSNYGATFHDITTGNNTSASSPNNYYAVTGYDLCTGWGTPSGTNLINFLAPLDALQISPVAGFNAAGGVGGPFTTTSATFVLTNNGSNGMNWAAGGTAAWLTISPAIGALSPQGAAQSVTVSLNATASNEVAGAYSGLVQFTNLGDGIVESRTFTLDVITAPSISSAPTNLSVLGGQTAAFVVQAIGGLPLYYRWQQNGASLADNANIIGSATAALTIASVANSNIGSYTVVVSNAASVVTSTPPAILSIIPSGPVITAQPAGQFALVGTSVNFNVTALGSSPLVYQWRCNATNLSDGSGITGSATPNLTLNPATSGNVGTYTVVVSNSFNAVTSAPAPLTIYALANSQLIQNGGFETGNFAGWNQTGNSSFDTVSAGGLFAYSGLYGAEMGPVGSIGYLSQTVPTTPGGVYLLSFWLDSPDGATPNEFLTVWNGYTLFDQTNLPGVGWSNYQFAVTATASNTTVEFGFRDDSSFFGLDNVSLEPLLNSAGPPVITAQPASQTYTTLGAAASLTVGAQGQTPLFYQWESNNVPIAGATNGTLSFTNVGIHRAGTYNVIVSNSLGTVTSSNAVLTIVSGVLSQLTFDDLSGTNLQVPNGYAGLSWSNFDYMDTASSAPNPSGFLAGTVSQPNIAYNNYGTAASISNGTAFSVLSAWLTAAWNNNLRLEVRGYASNALVYDEGFTLSATNPTLLNFNCVNVTNIEFISSGGTPNSTYGDSGYEFVMDNMSIITPTAVAPANDVCNAAVIASGAPYTNSQSTAGVNATNNPTPSCYTEFTNAVWYQFTPPGNGEMQLSTAGSSFPAAMAVYTGTCDALTQAACNTNAVAVTGGVNYHILIGASANVSGNLVFTLSLSTTNSGPPYILSSPTNVTVPAGTPVTFKVVAEGAPTLNYTWQRNGVAIAGATAAAYTYASPQVYDTGAQFTCVVSNGLGTSTSSAATLVVSPPGQLILNGGFETGDFTDWTLTGNTIDMYVNTVFVHSGTYGAALGPVGSLSYLSQTVPLTPGQLYLLSLWLDSPNGNTPNQFTVAWNGTTLFNQTNMPDYGWTNLQFVLTATTSNATLQIGARDDPAYLGLDDITVFPLKPALTSSSHTGSSINFSWSALPGLNYQIQSTTNLRQSWQPLGSNITATNYTMSTNETLTGASQRFYRVIAIAP